MTYVQSLTSLLGLLIPSMFGALGLILVAKVNRNPTPMEHEDAVTKRMEGLVDRLQADLERRARRMAEQDDDIKELRQEVAILHRLVSACYRVIIDAGLELPAPSDPPS